MLNRLICFFTGHRFRDLLGRYHLIRIIDEQLSYTDIKAKCLRCGSYRALK